MISAARRILDAAVILAPAVSAAQTWRTLDASRQLRDTVSPLTVRVEYGAGRVTLGPAAPSVLYELGLRYDADRAEPMTQFDAAAHSLVLGLASRGVRMGGSDSESGSLRAALSTRVPMDLALELGAVEGDADLSGLRLRSLSLKTGAADVSLRFSRANPERMRDMVLNVGAAKLLVAGGSFAGADRINATVAAGVLDLDLSGTLEHDVELSVNMAVGHCTIRLSRETAVSIEATTFLADFDKAGLEKRADGWYSPGFEQASRHLRIHLRAFVGGCTLSRNSA